MYCRSSSFQVTDQQIPEYPSATPDTIWLDFVGYLARELGCALIKSRPHSRYQVNEWSWILNQDFKKHPETSLCQMPRMPRLLSGWMFHGFSWQVIEVWRYTVIRYMKKDRGIEALGVNSQIITSVGSRDSLIFIGLRLILLQKVEAHHWLTRAMPLFHETWWNYNLPRTENGKSCSVPMALVEVLQCIWRDSIARLWASQGATAKGRWMNVSWHILVSAI